jgi:Tfp pilus assembly protein PilF
MAMAKEHPLLGVGPGTFYVHYPAYAIVARTDLAHSSYLQIAGEQGFPALVAAIAAIIGALVAGAASLLRRATRDEDALLRLLLCGSIGGVLAGALRSIFDSEWTLLGNGIAFWTVAGLAAAGISTLAPAASGETVRARSPLVLRISAALGLVFSVLLLQGVQARDSIQAQFQQTRQSVPQTSVWPPDPNILLYTGQPDEAARIEPSAKRWYQLAEWLNRNGKQEEAIEMYRRATEVDPNAMQTWRKLAVTLQEQGHPDQARDAWARIAALDEGMVGQVRAIPELREIHPAFAYTALAEDAVNQGKTTEAAKYYQKAAEVIEDYSRTTPQYQQMELLSAMMTGADVTARREEIRALYESVISQWIKLQPERRAELEARRDETLARLEKFAKPETTGTINPESNTLK